jgi:hypothetical protein
MRERIVFKGDLFLTSEVNAIVSAESEKASQQAKDNRTLQLELESLER